MPLFYHTGGKKIQETALIPAFTDGEFPLRLKCRYAAAGTIDVSHNLRLTEFLLGFLVGLDTSDIIPLAGKFKTVNIVFLTQQPADIIACRIRTA